MHPRERDARSATEEDARTLRGAAVSAGLVLNGAARSRTAVAGDGQAGGRAGGVEDDAVRRAVRARPRRDASEGEARRADGRVGDVEGRAGGRRERVDD